MQLKLVLNQKKNINSFLNVLNIIKNKFHTISEEGIEILYQLLLQRRFKISPQNQMFLSYIQPPQISSIPLL